MAEDAILNKQRGSAGQKRVLRAELRAQRMELAAGERMRDAESVARTLLDRPDFSRPGYVAGYWAMGGELPLHMLQMQLHPGQVWCLPCIQPDLGLRFAAWHPGDELVTNRFGIPEPALASSSQLDAAAMTTILLPLLAFTRGGTRLGMGGGYYDRTLGFRRQHLPPPTLVGVGYPFQERETLPGDPWDVRLDAIVTSREYIDCSLSK